MYNIIRYTGSTDKKGKVVATAYDSDEAYSKRDKLQNAAFADGKTLIEKRFGVSPQ